MLVHHIGQFKAADARHAQIGDHDCDGIL